MCRREGVVAIPVSLVHNGWVKAINLYDSIGGHRCGRTGSNQEMPHINIPTEVAHRERMNMVVQHGRVE